MDSVFLTRQQLDALLLLPASFFNCPSKCCASRSLRRLIVTMKKGGSLGLLASEKFKRISTRYETLEDHVDSTPSTSQQPQNSRQLAVKHAKKVRSPLSASHAATEIRRIDEKATSTIATADVVHRSSSTASNSSNEVVSLPSASSAEREIPEEASSWKKRRIHVSDNEPELMVPPDSSVQMQTMTPISLVDSLSKNGAVITDKSASTPVPCFQMSHTFVARKTPVQITESTRSTYVVYDSMSQLVSPATHYQSPASNTIQRNNDESAMHSNLSNTCNRRTVTQHDIGTTVDITPKQAVNNLSNSQLLNLNSLNRYSILPMDERSGSNHSATSSIIQPTSFALNHEDDGSSILNLTLRGSRRQKYYAVDALNFEMPQLPSSLKLTTSQKQLNLIKIDVIFVLQEAEQKFRYAVEYLILNKSIMVCFQLIFFNFAQQMWDYRVFDEFSPVKAQRRIIDGYIPYTRQNIIVLAIVSSDENGRRVCTPPIVMTNKDFNQDSAVLFQPDTFDEDSCIVID